MSDSFEKSPLAVVAIGGNAIIADDKHRSLEDQAAGVARACAGVTELVARGWRVTSTTSRASAGWWSRVGAAGSLWSAGPTVR